MPAQSPSSLTTIPFFRTQKVLSRYLSIAIRVRIQREGSDMEVGRSFLRRRRQLAATSHISSSRLLTVLCLLIVAFLSKSDPVAAFLNVLPSRTCQTSSLLPPRTHQRVVVGSSQRRPHTTTLRPSTAVQDSLQSLFDSVKSSKEKQTIFVGGKGGVGKVRKIDDC